MGSGIKKNLVTRVIMTTGILLLIGFVSQETQAHTHTHIHSYIHTDICIVTSIATEFY